MNDSLSEFAHRPENYWNIVVRQFRRNRIAVASLWVVLALFLLALSAGFALLYLLGGLLGIYFIRKKMSTDLLKGYLNISILVYGINFIVTAYFTFIFPIAFTGLVLIALVLARFTLKAK